MSSRIGMIATLYQRAKTAGWADVEHEDMAKVLPEDWEAPKSVADKTPYGQVTLMLGANGATPQMKTDTIRGLLRWIGELGGPEDYPLDEDYDLPEDEDYEAEDRHRKAVEAFAETLADEEHARKAEALAARTETVQAVAKALDITTDEARDQLAYEENDPAWAKEWQELLAEEAAAGDSQTAMDSIRDAEASKTEAARDEALETEALESEYAPEYTPLEAAELAQTADEERPEYADDDYDDWAEAMEALRLAAQLNERERYKLDMQGRRIEEALDRALSRNVVEGGNGHVGVDGLHEDISPFGPTMKELWRGEAARPNQFLPEVIDMGDRNIIARKGDEVRVFWSQVAASVKADLEASGYEFFHTTKERANELARTPKITAQRAGRMVTKTVDGREVAPPGWKIRVSGNGLPVQFFQSVNERAWDGLQLRLVRQA